LKGRLGGFPFDERKPLPLERQARIQPGYREIGEMALTNFSFIINFLLGEMETFGGIVSSHFHQALKKNTRI
jgi:hypothetical protein